MTKYYDTGMFLQRHDMVYVEQTTDYFTKEKEYVVKAQPATFLHDAHSPVLLSCWYQSSIMKLYVGIVKKLHVYIVLSIRHYRQVLAYSLCTVPYQMQFAKAKLFSLSDVACCYDNNSFGLQLGYSLKLQDEGEAVLASLAPNVKLFQLLIDQERRGWKGAIRLACECTSGNGCDSL